MRRLVLGLVLGGLLAGCVTAALEVPEGLFPTGEGKALVPATPHPAVIPVSRESEPKWVELVDRIATEIKEKGTVDILLLGDSITQGWRKHEDLWHARFGGLSTLNGGIWADGTQHLLWRLENGKFDDVDPRLVILLVGTNNGGQTAPQIAEGVYANVEASRRLFPRAKLLLLGIFPSNEDPQSKRRLKMQEVNVLLKTVADNEDVFFLDISAVFLGPGGSISKEIMPDYLHLTRKGFELWGDAMAPAVRALLGENPVQAG